MDEITAVQALDGWLKNDAADVKSYQCEFRWDTPPLEAKVAFLEHRLLNALSHIAVIVRILAKEQSNSAGTGNG